MNGIFQSYDLTTMQWFLIPLCAMCVGMATNGIIGMGLMVVPILASVFGGRPSVGFLLLLLIMGESFAVIWYKRHVDWKHIMRLLPWAFIGVVSAALVGKLITDTTFNQLLAGLVIFGISILVWQDLRSKRNLIPDYRWLSIVLGLLGGFATMMGNAGGPVLALYLLSMRLPKNSFIGTMAWFFLIVDLAKVPFHVFSWKTITLQSFLLDVMMIPAIAAGAFLGIYLVRLLPERVYRIFIILTTLIAALMLFRL